MWLLNVNTYTLEAFEGENIPEYAILSHRWEEDELSHKGLLDGNFRNQRGFRKVDLCCKQAIQDSLKYVWIDTCCIDKTSSAELSEAINSMWKWYRNSSVCYAYLADVNAAASAGDYRTTILTESLWFTRGWTLQELIAPRQLVFYDLHWSPLGSRAFLGEHLEKRTRIPKEVLKGDISHSLTAHSIAERMSWAAGRTTTRVEDRAYSLLGIFGINMPLLYGEGENAFTRLQEEIIRTSSDSSIFAWSHKVGNNPTLLAGSPDSFALARGYQDFHGFFTETLVQPTTITVNLALQQYAEDTITAMVGYFRGRVFRMRSELEGMSMLLRKQDRVFQRINSGPIFLVPNHSIRVLRPNGDEVSGFTKDVEFVTRIGDVTRLRIRRNIIYEIWEQIHKISSHRAPTHVRTIRAGFCDPFQKCSGDISYLPYEARLQLPDLLCANIDRISQRPCLILGGNNPVRGLSRLVLSFGYNAIGVPIIRTFQHVRPESVSNNELPPGSFLVKCSDTQALFVVGVPQFSHRVANLPFISRHFHSFPTFHPTSFSSTFYASTKNYVAELDVMRAYFIREGPGPHRVYLDLDSRALFVRRLQRKNIPPGWLCSPEQKKLWEATALRSFPARNVQM